MKEVIMLFPCVDSALCAESKVETQTQKRYSGSLLALSWDLRTQKPKLKFIGNFGSDMEVRDLLEICLHNGLPAVVLCGTYKGKTVENALGDAFSLWQEL